MPPQLYINSTFQPPSKKLSGMGSRDAQVLNTASLQPSQYQNRADLIARPSRPGSPPQQALAAKVGLHIPYHLQPQHKQHHPC